MARAEGVTVSALVIILVIRNSIIASIKKIVRSFKTMKKKYVTNSLSLVNLPVSGSSI